MFNNRHEYTISLRYSQRLSIPERVFSLRYIELFQHTVNLGYPNQSQQRKMTPT